MQERVTSAPCRLESWPARSEHRGSQAVSDRGRGLLLSSAVGIDSPSSPAAPARCSMPSRPSSPRPGWPCATCRSTRARPTGSRSRSGAEVVVHLGRAHAARHGRAPADRHRGLGGARRPRAWPRRRVPAGCCTSRPPASTAARATCPAARASSRSRGPRWSGSAGARSRPAGARSGAARRSPCCARPCSTARPCGAGRSAPWRWWPSSTRASGGCPSSGAGRWRTWCHSPTWRGRWCTSRSTRTIAPSAGAPSTSRDEAPLPLAEHLAAALTSLGYETGRVLPSWPRLTSALLWLFRNVPDRILLAALNRRLASGWEQLRARTGVSALLTPRIDREALHWMSTDHYYDTSRLRVAGVARHPSGRDRRLSGHDPGNGGGAVPPRVGRQERHGLVTRTAAMRATRCGSFALEWPIRGSHVIVTRSSPPSMSQWTGVGPGVDVRGGAPGGPWVKPRRVRDAREGLA